MVLKFLFLVGFFLGCLSAEAQDSSKRIHPGKIWNDTQGRPINAHGGGILYYHHVYYWFGEIKEGKTWRVAGISSWEDYRVNAGGISCYSSADLLHWRKEGIALAPDMRDSTSDLHISKVMERPKVIYNSRTRQFVMWLHIDQQDYSYARAGVAVSNGPEGPFRYLGSFRPNRQMSRDMTLFQDDDGKAYLVYSAENNKTMQICLLSEDYLRPSTTYRRILIGENREAPALFKYQHKYYLITSLCTGWDPNPALYAVADQPLGEWKLMGNPCQGPDRDSSYHAQVNYVLAVPGKATSFIFMADRWQKTDLEKSRYLWLPLHMQADRPVIQWEDAWKPPILPAGD